MLVSAVQQSKSAICVHISSFPGGSVVKNLPVMKETKGSIPGLGRSAGEGNATHSIILVWRIPWMEEPGRLQSMRL